MPDSQWAQQSLVAPSAASWHQVGPAGWQRPAPVSSSAYLRWPPPLVSTLSAGLGDGMHWLGPEDILTQASTEQLGWEGVQVAV